MLGQYFIQSHVKTTKTKRKGKRIGMTLQKKWQRSTLQHVATGKVRKNIHSVKGFPSFSFPSSMDTVYIYCI